MDTNGHRYTTKRYEKINEKQLKYVLNTIKYD